MSMPKSVLQKEHVALTFGTPVSTYLWPDSENRAQIAALASIILKKETADDGIARSNVGGWHSQTDLFFFWGQRMSVRTLKDRVTSYALDMTQLATVGEGPRKINLQIDGWANVVRRGHYNSVHDHAGTTWSGVYYVSRGIPDNEDFLNGKLELLDPRIGVNVFGREDGLFRRSVPRRACCPV